jgi:predicted ester cyclase
MDRQALENLSRQWISLWCAPVAWLCFERLHAETFEDYSAVGRAPDKAGFALGLAELTQAFPDLQTWSEDLVIDEHCSQVAVRWAAEGIHRGALLGLDPTHQRTTFAGIEILEVAEGQVTGRLGGMELPLAPAGTVALPR